MNALFFIWISVSAGLFGGGAPDPVEPEIGSAWWTIASDPNLGPLTSAEQQPVDFAIWQAADGTWQLMSCVRNTKAPGKTRLFYRWEGRRLTDSNWIAKGIAMEADPALGETPGGLQAPHVIRVGLVYHLFYGDWEHICHAVSDDGKQFRRVLQTTGKTGMFGEGPGANSRDPNVIRISRLWHCYYTAFPNSQGSVYCRTSKNFYNWSEPRIVAFGGESGTGPFSAECPFVVEPVKGLYYLFRTQAYGEKAITRVYYSADPMNFGINDDARRLVKSLPVAAPEIIRDGKNHFIAALLPSLKGIQMARLKWIPMSSRHAR